MDLVSAPNKPSSVQFTAPTQQTGILKNFHLNSVTNLSMEENKEGNQKEHQDKNKTNTLGNTNINTTFTGSSDQNPTSKVPLS